MAHAWHDIPLPEDPALETFPVVIEIPRGTRNKYELDKQTGLLFVDRVIHAAMYYPANYGFFPRTLGEDGDPLDALVFGQEPVMPLAYLLARPIGGFRMRDEKGVDDKIVCVHVNDPAFRGYADMGELPDYVIREMMRFFEDYKLLENKVAQVGDKLGRPVALKVVRDAAARYRREVRPGRA